MVALTEKEKGARQLLVDKYNRARSKETKHKRWNDLMEFEKKMLGENKNG